MTEETEKTDRTEKEKQLAVMASKYANYLRKFDEPDLVAIAEGKALTFNEYLRAKRKPKIPDRSQQRKQLAEWYQKPLEQRLKQQAIQDLVLVLKAREMDLNNMEDELDDLLMEEIGAGEWA